MWVKSDMRESDGDGVDWSTSGLVVRRKDSNFKFKVTTQVSVVRTLWAAPVTHHRTTVHARIAIFLWLDDGCCLCCTVLFCGGTPSHMHSHIAVSKGWCVWQQI